MFSVNRPEIFAVRSPLFFVHLCPLDVILMMGKDFLKSIFNACVPDSFSLSLFMFSTTLLQLLPGFAISARVLLVI